MAHSLFERTIAFAGICQSIKLVQDVVRTGNADSDALQTSLHSIVMVNAPSTPAVFGNESNLVIGLKSLIDEFDSSQKDNAFTRYLINLLALERKLSQRRDSLAQLGERITIIERQLQHFSLLDDQMLSNLASVYVDCISTLGPRIQISGDPAQLQKTTVQHKVRALLLAGIRSAVLWRQIGGKRRHLIFSRKQMVEQANLILARHS